MSDRLALALDLTAIPEADSARYTVRRRRRPGVILRNYDAAARAGRYTIRPEQIGTRWRVVVTYPVGQARAIHESAAVFRSESEAHTRGLHFAMTMCGEV